MLASAPTKVALQTFELYANLSPPFFPEANPDLYFYLFVYFMFLFLVRCLHNPTQSEPDFQRQAVSSWWEKADGNHSHRGVKSLMRTLPGVSSFRKRLPGEVTDLPRKMDF